MIQWPTWLEIHYPERENRIHTGSLDIEKDDIDLRDISSPLQDGYIEKLYPSSPIFGILYWWLQLYFILINSCEVRSTTPYHY